MTHFRVIPAFGQPLNSPDYYNRVDAIVNVLRPYSTLRTVAQHLNDSGFQTPSGLTWHRLHVANYIRQRGLSTNTNTNDKE